MNIGDLEPLLPAYARLDLAYPRIIRVGPVSNVGVRTLYEPPQGVIGIVTDVFLGYGASANVGDRDLLFLYSDQVNIDRFRVAAPVIATASDQFDLFGSVRFAGSIVTTGLYQGFPLPLVPLLPNWFLKFWNRGGQAGDGLNDGSNIQVIEVPTGPARRDGALTRLLRL